MAPAESGDAAGEQLAGSRASPIERHMEFIAHASRDPELAGRFDTRSAALREAVAHYIAGYQGEAGEEFSLAPDDLALVLRALGIGLAVEALVSPDAVRKDLYGDFVELLVEMSRRGGPAPAPGDFVSYSETKSPEPGAGRRRGKKS
jgi:BetI-type transcriptional repressor, C-terminal